MSVSVSHIDTCLACYLQDHHNRGGEILIGVAVDGATTQAQVKTELLDEIARYDWPEDADHITDDMVNAAIDEAFSGVADTAAVFDSSLEVNESDNDWSDPVQAWFLITYDSAESDD